MSAIYAVIMMAVIVGTTIQVAEDSWTSPNAVFLMLLFSIFIIAAITHPQEFWCLVPGMLYFLTIPSGYLLLLIYSLCNLNIVSWGTREVEKKKKAVKKGFMSQFTIKIFNPTKYSESIRKFFREWLGVDSASTNNVILKQILTTLERIEKIKNDEEIEGVDLGFIAPEEIQDHKDRVNEYRKSQRRQASTKQNPSGLLRQRTGQSINSNNPYGPYNPYGAVEQPYYKQRDELINPSWLEHP